jgi:ferredoxin
LALFVALGGRRRYDAGTFRQRGRRPIVLKPDIDYDLCKSHGVCARTAPEIFELRDDGTYVIMEEVPEPRRAELMKAIELCPEQAIFIKDE